MTQQQHTRHQIPRLGDVGILTHIHLKDRAGIAAALRQPAQLLEAICRRLEDEYGGKCSAVIVTTDPFLPRELQDRDYRPDDDWRDEAHAAVAEFAHVQVLTSDVVTGLVRTVNPPLDAWHAVGSQAQSSTYQLPKVGFTLIREANPHCRIVQFDEDGLSSPDDIVAVTIAVADEAKRSPTTILSVGYKPVYDPTRITDPRLAEIINGTSTRTGQLADARGVLESLNDGRRADPVRIDVATGQAFLGAIHRFGPNVYSQVIAGGALLTPPGARSANYSCDRNLCVYGDDDTLTKIHRIVDGFDCRRLTTARAPQSRHHGGMPSAADAIWHCQNYLQRLLHGIAFQGAVCTDEFAACLREARPPGESERRAIWDGMLQRVSAAIECWETDQFADTALGVHVQGRRHSLFEALKAHGVVGGSYGPDGLTPELARVIAGSPAEARTMTDGTLGNRLARVLDDVLLYLDPRFQRMWEDLRAAAQVQ